MKISAVLRKHNRVILRVGGGLAFVVGMVFFCAWHFYGYPRLYYLDPKWNSQHSNAEYYRAMGEASLRGGGLSHDAALSAGNFGNKEIASMLISKLKAEDVMGCLGGSGPTHGDVALAMITNHDLGNSGEAWLDWWAVHQDQSQLEWIVDGFREVGVEINIPLTDGSIAPLLVFLSAEKRAENKKGNLWLNAYKLLRDSDFEPVSYLRAHPDLSPEAQEGAQFYSETFFSRHTDCRIGLLEDLKPVEEKYYGPTAWFFSGEGKFRIAMAMYFPMVLGAVLVACSFRKKKIPGV
mgnify:CR=1 FL=1